MWNGMAGWIAACLLVQQLGHGDARSSRGLGLEVAAPLDTVTLLQGHGGAAAAHSSGRRLLMDDDDEEPFVVTTPASLRDAMAKGRRNIEITAHLDLTTLPLQLNTGCPDGCDSVLPDMTLTKAVRGNCRDPPREDELEALTGTPGAVALLPMQPGQCLVIVNEDVFRTLGHRLWLDNLYIRVGHYRITTSREYAFIGLAPFEPLHWPLTGQGRRYVTRTTFQGDGAGPTVGVWAKEDTYIENCTFANLGGDGFGDACPDCTAAIVASDSAALSVVNSTFFDPAPFPGTSYLRAFEGGRVRISGCEFAPKPDLTEELFYTRGDATVYADDPSIRIRSDSGAPVAPLPLAAIPAPAPGANATFLERTDEWFAYRRKVLNQDLAPQTTPAAPAGPVPFLDLSIEFAPAPGPAEAAAALRQGDAADDDGDDDWLSGAAIAAIVLGALMLLCAVTACCLLLLLCRAWKRSSSQDKEEKVEAEPTAVDAAQAGGADIGAALPWDKPRPGPAAAYPQQPGRPQSGPSIRSTSSAGPTVVGAALAVEDDTDTSPLDSGSGPPAPPQAATEAQLQGIARIHTQLNAVVPGTTILQQYQLVGPSERIAGGRSVVAFATGVYDREPYALKFFAERAAFDAEVALQRGAVGALLPPVRAVHDPTAAPSSSGAGPQLPPCIVYARGESLKQWLKRSQTDVFQAVSVLSHTATRLRDIHTAGFVHCDIRPVHILLMPRQNRWTVIDFDKAAAVGAPVAPDCTLDYAAPEVVAAVAGGGTIPAQPAMDAWALGVVSFELLTGKRALESAKDGQATVLAQLRGDAELPWEGDRLTDETRRQLGVFRGAVLGLLCRDPAQRAPVSELCNACDNVVASQTTVGTS